MQLLQRYICPKTIGIKCSILLRMQRRTPVSPDLPEYIMGNEQVRVALRMARDTDAGDDLWQKMIEMMEKKERGEST